MTARKEKAREAFTPGPNEVVKHQAPGELPGGGSVGSADSGEQATRFAHVPRALQVLPRWLHWRWGRADDKGKRPKVPYYVDGTRRRGKQGSASDLAHLVGFDVAVASAPDPMVGGIGLGLIEGDNIVALDLDNKPDTREPLTMPEVFDLCRGTYFEYSPSGNAYRAFYIGTMEKISKGARGIEVFPQKQFVTVTGRVVEGATNIVAPLRDSIRKKLLALSGTAADDKARSVSSGPIGLTIEQARVMLSHLPPERWDDYHSWLEIGMALHHEFDGSAEAGALWEEMGRHSTHYTDDAVVTRWPGFGNSVDPVRMWKLRQYAQANGYVPPPTTAKAQREFGPVATARKFTLESAREVMNNRKQTDDRPVLGALLPIGLMMIAGKGGTGKTTVLATAAAHVTSGKALPPWEARDTQRVPGAVLWLTVEEDLEGIVIPRHIELGGSIDTLYRPRIERAQDAEGGWYAIDFDIEKNLRGLLEEAIARGTPIRLVVCDSLPGLIQWGRRNATNDSDVKQCLGRLGQMARDFGCCIAGVAHWNKKTELPEEHRMSGAQAWRETPRLSFTCERGYVYVNKSNDMEEMGTTFEQVVVKVLREIPAETEDGEPIKVTARRALFGPHLIRKEKLLEAKKVAAIASGEVSAEPRLTRLERLCAEVRDTFDLMGSPVKSAAVWAACRSAPNGEEKQAICDALRLEYRDARKTVLYQR